MESNQVAAAGRWAKLPVRERLSYTWLCSPLWFHQHFIDSRTSTSTTTLSCPQIKQSPLSLSRRNPIIHHPLTVFQQRQRDAIRSLVIELVATRLNLIDSTQHCASDSKSQPVAFVCSYSRISLKNTGHHVDIGVNRRPNVPVRQVPRSNSRIVGVWFNPIAIDSSSPSPLLFLSRLLILFTIFLDLISCH